VLRNLMLGRILAAVAPLVLVTQMWGGVILSPTAVLSNSAATTPGSPIESTINHAGLLTDFVSGVTDFDLYLALNPQHTPAWIPNEWFAAADVLSATIVYDLGGLYDIRRLALWNEEHSGATDIQLFSCTDAACTSPVPLGFFDVVDSPFGVSYGAQVFDLTDATTQYLQAIVRGPNVPNRFNAVSMGEIAFEANAVPEPSCFVLVALGLCGVLARRFRQ